MRDDESWMAQAAAEWADRETEEAGGKGMRISLPSFNLLSGAMKGRVIRHALNRAGGTLRRVDSRHVDAVRRLASGPRPQARIDLPNHVVARREYDHLVLDRFDEKPPEDFEYVLEGPGSYRLEAVGRSVFLELAAAADASWHGGSPWTAHLNRELIHFPLTIRNFRHGDHFVPLGMKGTKKIKDFFIERRLPASERAKVPLLIQGREILWVCGLRVDDRFKMTEGSGECLRVTFWGDDRPEPQRP